jgi:hypothetical protein
MVVLNPDGTVQSQGAVERLIQENSLLLTAAEGSLEKIETKGITETSVEEQAKRKIGKQMVAEGVTVGQIGWPVCECSY